MRMKTTLTMIMSFFATLHVFSQVNYDVIVYGGTPGGIIAAVAASRNAAKVLLIEQTRHVGGMNTSGLNTAESEHMINNAITGIAREFYTKLGANFPEG